MYFPIRKYVYFSNEALKAIAEGDQDMIDYYIEFLSDSERILKRDVCLITDAYFEPPTPEQERFFSLSRKTALCKEVSIPSRLEKAKSKLKNMSHEEYKALIEKY